MKNAKKTQKNEKWKECDNKETRQNFDVLVF